jgi:hypothetical protein
VQAPAERAALESCLRGLLAPIVRLGFTKGLGGLEIRELLDVVMVQTLERHYREIEQLEPTNLRLSIFAGMNKRRVESLRARRVESEYESLEFANELSELLGAWHSESKYSGPFALPLDIRVRGAAPSLEDLAKRYVSSASLDLVLKALLEARVIETVGEGILHPISTSFPTKWETASQLERMAVIGPAYLETLLTNAAAANEGSPTLFEATALTQDPIDPEAFAEFVEALKVSGRKFLHEQDALLSECSKANPVVKGGVGIYAFTVKRRDAIVIERSDRFGPRVVSNSS